MAQGFTQSIKRSRDWCLAGLIACSLWSSTVPATAQMGGATVLPTDVEPIPGRTMSPSPRPFTSEMQMRMWQRLPAPLFFAGSCETSMRIETNPYQFPQKKVLAKRLLPPGTDFAQLSQEEVFTITTDLSQVGALDNVHRITPTATVGWSFKPNTQVFFNTFFLRDSLIKNYCLNTNTGAVGIGGQQTFNITDKLSVQAQYIGRELWQSQQVPVFDHLPGLTLVYNPTPSLNLFINALLQVRFAHFIGSYMRELDPFYTWGGTYTKGPWTFSATSTFLQNFRSQFSKALTPINNYSFVCDFEIDRPVLSKFPGLIAFCRAEPVYNFASHATPGLAGMDFRFYYGFRLSAAKPALNDSMEQLRKRYLQHDTPQTPSAYNNEPRYDPLAIRRALLSESVSGTDPDDTVDDTTLLPVADSSLNSSATAPSEDSDIAPCLTVHGMLPEATIAESPNQML